MAGAHRSLRQDTDATRAAILDAASALFAERGYLATTVDDIAVAAHVATGTVYTSFGGKPQLLEAVVHRFADPSEAAASPDETPLSEPADGPVEQAAPVQAPPVEVPAEQRAAPVEVPAEQAAPAETPAAPAEVAEPEDTGPPTGAADVTFRLTPGKILERAHARSVIGDTVHDNRLATEAFADFYDLIHRNGKMDDTVASGASAAEDRMRRSADHLVARLAELNALRTAPESAVDLIAYFLGYLSWRRLVHDFGWSYDIAEEWLADRIGEALLIVEG